MTTDIRRPSTFRHESIVAQIVYVDQWGKPTGDLGDEETFVKVDGSWYPERTIKAGAVGYRDDQIQIMYLSEPSLIDAGLVLNDKIRDAGPNASLQRGNFNEAQGVG